MNTVIVELLPMILGAALTPIEITIVLLMLASRRGLAKAAAFVLGVTVVRLLQGVLFGIVFGASPDATAEDGGMSPVTSTLLLVVGILLLITCYREWVSADDPDDPPPQWMQSIDQAAPLKALGLGAGVVSINAKLWVFTLSAIGVIRAAGLGQTQGIIVYLIYAFLAQLLLILPILVCAIAPQASAVTLQRATQLLEQYNRQIMIVATLVFGVYFSWKGLNGLLV